MKRLVTLSLGMILCFAPMGCPSASSTTPTAALAPGYLNSADQAMGETLTAAHAFYVRIQSDTASGAYTPSPAEKAALNGLALSLNIAQPLYIAYHAGTATQAQAQAAVNNVSTNQTAVQSLGVK